MRSPVLGAENTGMRYNRGDDSTDSTQMLTVHIKVLGWPKSAFGFFLSKNKRHIFHFHQELY